MLIAVVDDDHASRFALGEVLQQAGHRVALFPNCDPLIDAIFGGRRFDAIILDMWMPTAAGHGPTCFARIRDVSPWQAERVIFATGGGLPLVMELFLEGRTWVEKPIELAELEKALERLPKGR